MNITTTILNAKYGKENYEIRIRIITDGDQQKSTTTTRAPRYIEYDSHSVLIVVITLRLQTNNDGKCSLLG